MYMKKTSIDHIHYRTLSLWFGSFHHKILKLIYAFRLIRWKCSDIASLLIYILNFITVYYMSPNNHNNSMKLS